MATKKQKLGQFFTTNYAYILDGMDQPDHPNIIEPFVGNGDLIKFLEGDGFNIESYDIDPKISEAIKRDTLLHPPNYTDKYVITNPPYLSRNKNSNKYVYTIYNENDLYKCFLRTIIDNPPRGGIIIIPLNFWCSIRANDVLLRKDFLNKFAVSRINVFEEQVFNDTSYTVCSIQFTKILEQELPQKRYNFVIYPSKKIYTIALCRRNNFSIGGELYTLPQNSNINIDRLTKINIKSKSKFITNIKLYALDNNLHNKIRLVLTEPHNRFIDNTRNLSERTFATLIIEPKLSIASQKRLVKLFNKYIEVYRKKYNSMFLSNYRESTSISRKRISFSLVYMIINKLLQRPIFGLVPA